MALGSQPFKPRTAPSARLTKGSWRRFAISFVAVGALSVAAACGDDKTGVGPGNDQITSVELVPAHTDLPVGGTATLKFAAKKSDGTPIDGVTPTWQTSDASKVTVNNTGMVTAMAVGTAQITATIGAFKATSAVKAAVASPVAGTWAVDREGLTEVSLLGVWAASPTSVFAVGQDGIIMRWTGGAWRTMQTPTSETLVGIWGASETDVYAVGSNGVILHYDGNAWAAMQSGTTSTFLEVWGIDATHVYAVGTAGAMYRFDGTRWSAMTNNNGPTEIWGVWGWSPSDLMAVGQNGVILHFDGTSWTSMASPVDGALFGVWGAAPNDVYAVGV
jgi:hypothetical protein